MPSFDKLFSASKERPVVYKGQALWRVDHFPVLSGQTLKVTFEKTDSEWRQGIDLETDGQFEVNDQMIRGAFVLWQDTAPREVIVRVETKKGECLVKNVWDTGNGAIHFWHNGAAMIVEEISYGRRYRCNDGRADDDFDDLIFSIKLIE